MPRRIVLLGATGYTGRLVAEALVRRKARPVLAGRNHQSLAALGVQLGRGLDIAIADVQRPESVAALLQKGDVIVSTVGPFTRLGRPAVEAAVAKGAMYLDSTGEPEFIRAVFEEYGPRAAETGAVLLTAFGYDYVPGNLAATIALDGLPAATQVDVGYFLRGSLRAAASLGTRASAGAIVTGPNFAWRDGGLRTVQAAERSRNFDLGGRPIAAISIGGSEHIALPRVAPGLRDVGVYIGVGRSDRAATVARRTVTLTTRIPGGSAALRWLAALPIGREGAPADERERVGAEVVAEARDDGGRVLRTTRLRGANPYTFTGEILAWAADELGRTPLEKTGALGPVEAFGLQRLRDACAAAGLPEVSAG